MRIKLIVCFWVFSVFGSGPGTFSSLALAQTEEEIQIKKHTLEIDSQPLIGRIPRGLAPRFVIRNQLMKSE